MVAIFQILCALVWTLLLLGLSPLASLAQSQAQQKPQDQSQQMASLRGNNNQNNNINTDSMMEPQYYYNMDLDHLHGRDDEPMVHWNQARDHVVMHNSGNDNENSRVEPAFGV